jgi:hypothetical protein
VGEGNESYYFLSRVRDDGRAVDIELMFYITVNVFIATELEAL